MRLAEGKTEVGLLTVFGELIAELWYVLTHHGSHV